MKKLHLIVAAAAAAMLSGCTTIDHKFNMYHDINLLRKMTPAGSPFTQALTKEYLAFSEMEFGRNDWVDSQFFAHKGIRAAGGESVLPEDPNDRFWVIVHANLQELIDGRGRLFKALDAGGRDRAAGDAAVAQVRFDCWVEEREEGWEDPEINRCKNEFLAAIGRVEAALRAPQPPAAPAAKTYSIFFDFDRANIRASEQGKIQEILTDARGYQPVVVNVVGRADAPGSEQYNLRLSLLRAQAVRDALVRGGIGADRITVEGLGEPRESVGAARPPRSDRDRRVDVTIRAGAR